MRRCAGALAVGAALSTSRPRRSTSTPAIQTSRCAGTTRCATTSASASQSQDSKIIGSPNFDDGDRNFDKGSLVANRFDVLSEFDFVYKRRWDFA